MQKKAVKVFSLLGKSFFSLTFSLWRDQFSTWRSARRIRFAAVASVSVVKYTFETGGMNACCYLLGIQPAKSAPTRYILIRRSAEHGNLRRLRYWTPTVREKIVRRRTRATCVSAVIYVRFIGRNLSRLRCINFCPVVLWILAEKFRGAQGCTSPGF